LNSFRRCKLKNQFKIAAVYIGTIVGAGLASGQEILQFFGLYGYNGFFGIIVCCILYIIFSHIIISLCFKFKFKSYSEIIKYVFGGKIGNGVDYLTTFFIFTGNIIMISGGGAMLNEYIGIDKFWGVMLMSIFAFTVTIFSTRGIVATNSIIVPFSTLAIILLGVLVLFTFKENGNTLGTLPVPKKSSFELMSSTLIYSSFNLLGVTGVLCPMICESNNKRDFLRGCTLGSIILTILAILINFSILYYAPKSFHFEIPNLFVSRHYGYLLPFFLTIIIWLEMFSTEIGDLYSLSKALQHSKKIPYAHSLLIILGASLPFTFIGFSNLIKLLYPAFGALSFIFILGCLYRYIKISSEL
jgi:uncharacterized membrane protein YkvI